MVHLYNPRGNVGSNPDDSRLSPRPSGTTDATASPNCAPKGSNLSSRFAVYSTDNIASPGFTTGRFKMPAEFCLLKKPNE